MNEFAGIDFDLAIGEIYGLRMWIMDEYGRLRARNWSKAGPWRPGLNTALCLADKSSPNITRIIDPSGRGRKAVEVSMDYTVGQGYIPSSWANGPVLRSPEPSSVMYHVHWDDGSTNTLSKLQYRDLDKHDAPADDCSCGFYAYTDLDHPDANLAAPHNEYVVGVIRGSGRTLIGTKGFRCEKAEIIALIDPTRGGRKTGDWRQKQARLLRKVYPDVPLLPSRAALLEFAPVESQLPDPATEEFWKLP